MSKSETLQKVEQAVASGQLWRAKEILRDSIATYSYDTEIYEAYGRILLKTCDMLEAGKFLFLTGKCQPEYTEAIDLFLNRHKHNVQAMFRMFPAAARKNNIDDYPVAVKSKLQELGFTPKQLKESKQPAPATVWGKIKSTLGLIVFFIIIIFICVALFEMIKTVVNFFTYLFK